MAMKDNDQTAPISADAAPAGRERRIAPERRRHLPVALPLAAGILPLLLFAVVMVVVFQNQQRIATEELLMRAAANTAQALNERVSSIIGLVRGLTTSSALDKGDIETFRIEAERLRASSPDLITNMILTDEQRQVMNLDIPANQPLPISRRPETLAQAWATQQPVVSSLLLSLNNSGWIVSLRVPIVRDGRTIYTLVTPIRPNVLGSVFDDLDHPDGWSGTLVGADGVVIARRSSGEEDAADAASIGTSLKQSPFSYLEQIENDRFSVLTEMGGSELYASKATVPLTGWTVIVEAPASMIDVGPKRARLLVWICGALASLVAVALSIALTNGMFARRENAYLAEANRDLLNVQQSLRLRTAELESLMDLIPAAVYVAHGSDAAHIEISHYGATLYRLTHGQNASRSAYTGPRPEWRAFKDGIEVAVKDLPIQRAARGAEIRDEELEISFPDGSRFSILVNASPIRDTYGNAIGAVGIGFNITERKRTEEQQKLVMAELDHRVRNMLASIRSMMSLAERYGQTKEVYAEAIRGRVDALALAHGQLAKAQWHGASLRQLITDELEAYTEQDQSRLGVSGDDLLLKPAAAESMALVIHELATNAGKYGALSKPEGRVEVSWKFVEHEGEPFLDLHWTESGGPTVTPPTRRGFGSILIEASLAHRFQAKVKLTYAPEGLLFTALLPLEEIGAEKKDEPAAPPPRQEEPTPRYRGGLLGARILLVEDEVLIGEDMKAILEKEGADVVGPLAQLDRALETAGTDQFDMALLDVNLGGQRVFPLADLLEDRQIPFMFMTGYVADSSFPIRHRGATALQKPVSPGELVRTAEQLLDGKVT